VSVSTVLFLSLCHSNLGLPLCSLHVPPTFLSFQGCAGFFSISCYHQKLEQLDQQEQEIAAKIETLEAEKREAFLNFRQLLEEEKRSELEKKCVLMWFLVFVCVRV
jgi:hypothetical protein